MRKEVGVLLRGTFRRHEGAQSGFTTPNSVGLQRHPRRRCSAVCTSRTLRPEGPILPAGPRSRRMAPPNWKQKWKTRFYHSRIGFDPPGDNSDPRPPPPRWACARRWVPDSGSVPVPRISRTPRRRANPPGRPVFPARLQQGDPTFPQRESCAAPSVSRIRLRSNGEPRISGRAGHVDLYGGGPRAAWLRSPMAAMTVEASPSTRLQPIVPLRIKPPAESVQDKVDDVC